MEESTISTPTVESAPSSEPEAPRPGFLAGLASSNVTPFNPPRANDTNVEPDPLNIASHRGKLGEGADEIIRTATRDLRRDPALWKQLQQCQGLYGELAQHEAAGDRLAASRIRTEIMPLERRLQNAFGAFVAARSRKR